MSWKARPTLSRIPLAAALLAASLGAAAPAAAVVPEEVAVARGIGLINEGRYREALEFLEEALYAAPRSAEALFYAGVARSRLGDHREAERLLRKARAEAETSEVDYELGRIAAQGGRCREADRLFARAAELAEGGAAAPDAAALLAACRARGGDRSFQASLSLGWQHDSNVVLDPDNPVAPRDRTADDRAILHLVAGGTLPLSDFLELGAKYSFYGSRHDSIDDYDALYHRIAPTLALTAWQAVRPSLGYSFEHTSFGGDAYAAVHTGSLRVAVPEGARAATEGSVEYRDSRFSDSALFPDNEERTGSGWSLVLRQSLGAGPVEGSLFGALDRDDAREDWWVSSGWRAGGQATWRIASPLLLGVTGEYRAVDYDEAKAAGDPAREDRILQLGASLTWAPWRHGSISVTASRTRDDSNLEAYTYTRTIYGVVVTLGI